MRIFRSSDFEEKHDEEGSRAALIGPDKAGAGEVLAGITVPAFSAFICAPVLELADRRGLQPRAHSGRPGPIPGWGTTFTQTENRYDNSTKWRKNKNRSAKRVNPDPKRKDWSLKAIRKQQLPNSSKRNRALKFVLPENEALFIFAPFQQVHSPETI